MESLRESIQSRGGTSDVKAPAPVTFKFYYTRRMAAILAEEAEKARVLEEEKERQRQLDEDEHRRRYAIVERIKVEMAEKEATE